MGANSGREAVKVPQNALDGITHGHLEWKLFLKIITVEVIVVVVVVVVEVVVVVVVVVILFPTEYKQWRTE